MSLPRVAPEVDTFLAQANEIVRLGVRERLAAERLRREVPAEALRDALVAMLARTREEQEDLARLYDRCAQSTFPRRASPTGGPPSRRWMARSGALFALALLGFLLARPPTPTRPTQPPPGPGPTGGRSPTLPSATEARVITLSPETTTAAQEAAPRPPLPLPLWLLGTLVSGLFFTLGVRWLRLPGAWRAALPQRETEQQTRIAAEHARVMAAGLRRAAPLVLYRVPAPLPFTAAEREDLAALFGILHRSERGPDLDVPATVRTTLAEGNRPTPVFRPERRLRELLVLYDREQRDNYPDLGPFLRLLDDWERRALRLTRYYFHRQPDRLFSERGGPSIPLAGLHRRHPQAALLLFSRRQQSELRDQQRWLPLARQWDLRAWIDPDPRAAKSERQARLCATALVQAGLSRFPFTVAGLKALARHLAEGGLGPGPPPWPPFASASLADGPLRLWAVAAALVPEASWDQLEVFRVELGAVAAAYGDRRAVHQLLSAVATKTGQPAESDEGRTIALPPSLVAELQTWLLRERPQDAARVLAILEEQLGAAPPCEEATDPYAFWNWSFKVALLDMWKARSAAPLERLLDSPFGEAARARLRKEQGGTVLPASERDRLAKGLGRAETLARESLWRGHQRLTLEGLAVAVCAGLLFSLTQGRLPGAAREVAEVTPAHFRVEVRRVEPKTAQRPALLEVRPGSFQMGSPTTEDGRDTDEQQHEVRITRPYLLAETEVTQAQYEALLKTNPAIGKGEGTQPVENVTWFDAITYCNALSAQEHRTPCYARTGDTVTWNQDCTGYRLPTEAEWEYAARAGQPGRFSGGDEPGSVAWYDENSQGRTHPVGTKAPNAWGFRDMSGNVWEWVWDWYDPAYGKPSGATSDPTGPSNPTSAGPWRVPRGGSFRHSAQNVRVAYRGRYSPQLAVGNLGFRVARSLPSSL